MTVIAAYWTEKSAAIGGDSGAYDTEQDLLQISTIPKVWSGPDYLVGVAGTQRAINFGQTIYSANPYSWADQMCKANIDGEWVALFVRKDGIWHIDNAGSIFHFREPYGAVGGGQAVALGALAALHHAGHTNPLETVHTALQVTGAHTASCVPEYKVLTQFF